MNNLFLLLLLFFFCVGFCSFWFFYFSVEGSQERGGEGVRKQPQQRENAVKVFLAAFRIAPFGTTNLCVQFVT